MHTWMRNALKCGLLIIFPDVHDNIYKLAIETIVQVELLGRKTLKRQFRY